MPNKDCREGSSISALSDAKAIFTRFLLALRFVLHQQMQTSFPCNHEAAMRPGVLGAPHQTVRTLDVCVCVWKPWSHRSPLGVNTQGATGAPKERWPTKTSSGTRENVPAKLVTCCSHCCLLSWWFMWGRRFVDTMLPSAFLTSFFRLQDSPVLISSQSGNQASNVVH